MNDIYEFCHLVCKRNSIQEIIERASDQVLLTSLKVLNYPQTVAQKNTIEGQRAEEAAVVIRKELNARLEQEIPITFSFTKEQYLNGMEGRSAVWSLSRGGYKVEVVDETGQMIMNFSPCVSETDELWADYIGYAP